MEVLSCWKVRNKIETGVKIINRDQEFQYYTSSSDLLFAISEASGTVSDITKS